MKKNKALTAAFSVFALTMMSMCAIGGTFAKYVTKGTASDTAQVAKWGVTVTGTGNMFAESYNGNKVDAASTYDVVAPGTSGSLAEFVITGTPEVAVTVSYTATLNLGENWAVNEEYYCPIVITVNEVDFDGNEYDSADLFEAAVNAAIVARGATFGANTNLSAQTNDNLNVSWSWAYVVNDANDVKDTALGDAAAAGNAPTISLTVGCTVTQDD